MHTIENSGGYFYRGRFFLWILDINLKNLWEVIFQSSRCGPWSPCPKWPNKARETWTKNLDNIRKISYLFGKPSLMLRCQVSSTENETRGKTWWFSSSNSYLWIATPIGVVKALGQVGQTKSKEVSCTPFSPQLLRLVKKPNMKIILIPGLTKPVEEKPLFSFERDLVAVCAGVF